MGFGLWCVARWPVLSGNGRSIFRGLCLPITFFPAYQSKELLWCNFNIWGNTAQANSVRPLFHPPWFWKYFSHSSPQGLTKSFIEELRIRLNITGKNSDLWFLGFIDSVDRYSLKVWLLNTILKSHWLVAFAEAHGRSILKYLYITDTKKKWSVEKINGFFTTGISLLCFINVNWQRLWKTLV